MCNFKSNIMKYKMYLSTLFVALLLMPLVGANTKTEESNSKVDMSNIEFFEISEEIDLGFDTKSYLPADFDPYAAASNIHSIDFIEIEEELIIDTKKYLPENFNAYK